MSIAKIHHHGRLSDSGGKGVWDRIRGCVRELLQVMNNFTHYA